jgi:hypothetical protein
MLCVQRAVPVHSASTHTLSNGTPDRLATLPEELVREVLGRVDRPTLCALAAVSSDLGVAVHPFIQGHAVDGFLLALVNLIEAYDKQEGTFGWADECQWVCEWDNVPVDRVVAWLQSQPKDNAGLPTGVDAGLPTGVDDEHTDGAGNPMSILEPLYRHIDLYGSYPDGKRWCADTSRSPFCDEIDELWVCLEKALRTLRVRDLIDGMTRMKHLRTRVRNVVARLDGI